MSTKRMLVLLVAVIVTVLFTACAGPQGEPGPAGPAGPAGPQGEAGPAPQASELSCTECHNDTTVIASKVGQFRETSVHGTGESFIRGEEGTCAGCHGTEGAKARINANLPPHDASIEGVKNVSPFGCRTCHNVHVTYTGEDWALTGAAQPVKMEYSDGTFDGGAGNLCANCHQIRNPQTEAAGGNIEITSTRFGTHYGVEAQMLLGEGGIGVTGTPSAHYSGVEDTCVACHMGEERNHTYLPAVERCQACHSGTENFDINGVQTEVTARLEELKGLLAAAGILDPATDLAVPGTYPEAVASAMWNYKLVEYDQSMGVHNSAYTKALLDAAIAALQ